MKIGILFIDNMLATSALNALEVWHAARETSLVRSRSAARRDSGEFGGMQIAPAQRIIVDTIAVNELSVQLGSGLSFTAQKQLPSSGNGLNTSFHNTSKTSDTYDVIYVPALWRNPRSIIRKNRVLVDWLRQQYESGAVINATGTGVCFVAETGLLNGAAATTHWHYFDQFARDYPEVNLKRQHFITESGRIYCAGSINALTDLTIHHVHRFLGSSIADHLARHFSAEVRQPFDRLRFDQTKSDLHPDEEILQVQLWLENNIAKPNLNMNEVADLFGLSQRSLNRRFKEATGTTPIEYLQRLRHTEACELLKKSNLAIGDIAARVGISDSSYFSKMFKRKSDLSPNEYRKTTRAKLFNLKP